MLVSIQCVSCGKVFNLEVKASNYDAFGRHVMHAQNAFPELTPAERGLFISGICGDCGNEIFSEDEEDDFDN